MCAVSSELVDLALKYSRIPEHVREIPLDASDIDCYEKEILRLFEKANLNS